MKKKLISLLLVFSFLLNTVPLAFAVEDGAGQAENTEVSQVDPNGEEEAGNGGDEDVAAPEGTGKKRTFPRMPTRQSRERRGTTARTR